jgi:hypothetical protein
VILEKLVMQEVVLEKLVMQEVVLEKLVITGSDSWEAGNSRKWFLRSWE